MPAKFAFVRLGADEDGVWADGIIDGGPVFEASLGCSMLLGVNANLAVGSSDGYEEGCGEDGRR